MALQIKVFHDVPVPGSDAVVLTLVTTAEGLIVRAKLEVQEGLEGGPIIQALGVPLQQAPLAQQDREAEAENSRRGKEPGGPTTPGNGPPEHPGPGTLRLLCAQAGFLLSALSLPPSRAEFFFLPSLPPTTRFTEAVSEPCPFWELGSCLL